MLYLSVKSLSKAVDYTIEVFIISKGDVLPTIVAHLPSRSIQQKYIEDVQDTKSNGTSTMVDKAKGYLSKGPKIYEYELTFAGLNVED